MTGGVFGVTANVRVREDGTGREWTASNTLTSGGAALVRDWLAAPAPGLAPAPPSFVGLASGVVQDGGRFLTQVASEHFRTAICQRDRSGLSVIFHAYLEPTDANGILPSGVNVLPGTTLSAVALWAGAATDQINTGTLFAVANLDPAIHKTGAKSFSLDWIITASGKLT